MQFLMFTLYGPLAAFGDEGARLGYRGSWSRPSRSQVLGLVAAALGIDRTDDDGHRELADGLGFAVRTDAWGESLSEYQTFTHPILGKRDAVPLTRREELRGKTGTQVSDREYRTDALHTVALWHNGCRWSLDEITEAIQRPRWMLYIGRVCCPPALPVVGVTREADTLLDAFSQHPAVPDEIRELLHLDYAERPEIASDAHAPGVTPSRITRRRDGYRRTHGDLRLFSEREEWICT